MDSKLQPLFTTSESVYLSPSPFNLQEPWCPKAFLQVATPYHATAPAFLGSGLVFSEKHHPSNSLRKDFSGGAVNKNPSASAERWLQSLVREDSTCCRAIKLVRHNCWACAPEPVFLNKGSHCSETPVLHNWRVAPARHN